MVERTAADDGAEEGLLPPRRTDEKQAISDVTPASDTWPSADASAHVETDAAPDDDEPQPWRLTPAAKSERVEQSDADRSRTSGKASPISRAPSCFIAHPADSERLHRCDPRQKSALRRHFRMSPAHASAREMRLRRRVSVGDGTYTGLPRRAGYLVRMAVTGRDPRALGCMTRWSSVPFRWTRRGQRSIRAGSRWIVRYGDCVQDGFCCGSGRRTTWRRLQH